MPDQRAFRSNDARPRRWVDEMLAIGAGTSHARGGCRADCDEMHSWRSRDREPRPPSARGCDDGATRGRWTRRRGGRAPRGERATDADAARRLPRRTDRRAVLGRDGGAARHERCAELSLLGAGLGNKTAVRRPGPRDRHESRSKPRGREGPPIRLPRCRRSQRPDPHNPRENAARPCAGAEPHRPGTGRGGGGDPWARHGERGAAAVRGIQRAGTDALGGGATAATTHQGGQAAAGR